MTLAELLEQLAQQGIKLAADGDHLRIRGPEAALTPALQQMLVQKKAELLTWLRAEQAPSGTLPPIAPDLQHRYEPFPLTDIQHAYWVGMSGAFELSQTTYHAYLEIEGQDIDCERLSRAWQRVIERHEMLRTVVLPDGQQQILREAPVYQLPILDLRQQDQTQLAATLAAVRAEMSHQQLSPYQWPTFDIRAIRLNEQCTRLCLSFAMLFLDAASIFRVLWEWQRFYLDQRSANHPFEPLTLSFRDYVLAEKALEASALYTRAQDYWLKRLVTLPPAPALPQRQHADQLAEIRFQRRTFKLERPVWAQLKQRANQAGVTPSNVLLTAFADVLRTWSQQPRFTLNVTLFNRPAFHPQINALVGDFTLTNLLLIDQAGGHSFGERAEQVQRQLWQDLEHSAFNGVRVLREWARQHQQTAPGRALMPIVFTSTLGLGADESAYPFGDLVEAISQTPQVMLDHQVIEYGGALICYWDAVEDLFPPGLLDDMFAAYSHLIEQLATTETAWTAEQQSLIPRAQLAQRAAINATEAPVSSEMLHTLFLQQVAAHPDAPAVITPSRTLTYAELSTRANQAGHWLRAHGARPNTLVAIVMEKGWEQIVGVFGILFSGAAYLPVDPGLPAERQHYLLSQGEVALVLTQQKLAQTLSWPAGLQFLSVDEQPLNADLMPLASVQMPDDLAYVLFTSGTTGSPKGVAIEHRNAANTVLDINRRFGVSRTDRILGLSAINFDLSVYDIFGVLAAGGALVLPSAELRNDPAHWLELMVRYEVTLWNSVPALMQMLVEYVDGASGRQGDKETRRQGDKINVTLRPYADTPIRLVLLSGDWIPVTLPPRIKTFWPTTGVISLGGPTETSIWCVCYPIEQVDPTWPSIPYGQPLTNQTLHVLNEQLEPCPVWAPGEIYVGGLGVGRGYWRDPEKTGERFIHHPSMAGRLYKSGDLGRYLPDGNIEFLGRADFQVKIRGHRIELGEIEATLLQHPAVKEAVVHAIGDAKNLRQLVAYIVPVQATLNGQGQVPDVFMTQAADGVLTDPLARLEFKLSQPGVRTLDGQGFQLPLPVLDEVEQAAYLSRQSYRQFLTQPIPLVQFSDFLSCLLQMPIADAPLPKYLYPSAGSLYPVQTYLYVKPARVEGLAGGYYYYHPAHHQLLPLSQADDQLYRSQADGSGASPTDANQPVFDQSAFTLFLVGAMEAITPMYGDLADDFCLLEAGYMGQLLMTEAPAYEIGLCPIGGFTIAPALQIALGLDAGSDQAQTRYRLLHTLAGGRIDPVQRTQWGQPGHATATPVASWQTELQNYLAAKLPDYMVPTTYIALDSLPLTANGKVDRKALPLPDQMAQPAQEFVAPRTALETELAKLWCHVLGVEQVGIHHDFFGLGGDSLRVTQLLAALRQTLQIELPLRTLYEHRTIANLAQFIETMTQAARRLQDLSDLPLEDMEEGVL